MRSRATIWCSFLLGAGPEGRLLEERDLRLVPPSADGRDRHHLERHHAAFRHLALHPDDQAHLREDDSLPGRLPSKRSCVRSAPVTMGQEVTVDTVYRCLMKAWATRYCSRSRPQTGTRRRLTAPKPWTSSASTTVTSRLRCGDPLPVSESNLARLELTVAQERLFERAAAFHPCRSRRRRLEYGAGPWATGCACQFLISSPWGPVGEAVRQLARSVESTVLESAGAAAAQSAASSSASSSLVRATKFHHMRISSLNGSPPRRRNRLGSGQAVQSHTLLACAPNSGRNYPSPAEKSPTVEGASSIGDVASERGLERERRGTLGRDFHTNCRPVDLSRGLHPAEFAQHDGCRCRAEPHGRELCVVGEGRITVPGVSWLSDPGQYRRSCGARAIGGGRLSV